MDDNHCSLSPAKSRRNPYSHSFSVPSMYTCITKLASWGGFFWWLLVHCQALITGKRHVQTGIFHWLLSFRWVLLCTELLTLLPMPWVGYLASLLFTSPQTTDLLPLFAFWSVLIWKAPSFHLDRGIALRWCFDQLDDLYCKFKVTQDSPWVLRITSWFTGFLFESCSGWPLYKKIPHASQSYFSKSDFWCLWELLPTFFVVCYIRKY